LAIQGSAVASERAFSGGALTGTKRRNRLNPDNKKKSGKTKPVALTTLHASISPVNNALADITAPTNDTIPSQSATRITFSDFIELANLDDIKNFFTIAATTREGRNLEILWDRAYEEGRTTGRRGLIQTLE
jgi:hypothetical protein